MAEETKTESGTKKPEAAKEAGSGKAPALSKEEAKAAEKAQKAVEKAEKKAAKMALKEEKRKVRLAKAKQRKKEWNEPLSKDGLYIYIVNLIVSFIVILIGIGVASTTQGEACSVCFGGADPDTINAVKMGVLSLFLVLCGVGFCLVRFFWSVQQRAKQLP